MTAVVDTPPTTDDDGEGCWVTQLNGHRMEVLTAEEAEFYNAQRDGYMHEHAFTATSDLADLDRLLALELRMFRTERFLASGLTYDGREFTDAAMTALARLVKPINEQIQMIKTGLGLTRLARDKAKGESVGDYIATLQRRAKEFGIHRVRQVHVVLTLFNELASLIRTYDRANEFERMKLGVTSDAEIVARIRDTYIPRYEAVDAEFRQQQRFWVGDL